MELKHGCKPATFKLFGKLALEMSESLRIRSPILLNILQKRNYIKDQVTMENAWRKYIAGADYDLWLPVIYFLKVF